MLTYPNHFCTFVDNADIPELPDIAVLMGTVIKKHRKGTVTLQLHGLDGEKTALKCCNTCRHRSGVVLYIKGQPLMLIGSLRVRYFRGKGLSRKINRVIDCITDTFRYIGDILADIFLRK